MATKKKPILSRTASRNKSQKRNGRTSKHGNHSHSYHLDKDGSGETSRDGQHVHSVKNFNVRPAGKPIHSHTLM